VVGFFTTANYGNYYKGLKEIFQSLPIYIIPKFNSAMKYFSILSMLLLLEWFFANACQQPCPGNPGKISFPKDTLPEPVKSAYAGPANDGDIVSEMIWPVKCVDDLLF
jgi:hypothetical protein